MKKTVVFAIIIAFGLTLMNCGGQTSFVVTCKDHPDWVEKGGAAFKDKAFYGVGSVTNVRDVGLARDAADAKARANLAKNFSTEINNRLEQYQQSISSGNYPDQEHMEQVIEQGLITITKMELRGAMVVDRHACIKENTRYSLTRLDTEAFAKELEKIKDLPDEVQKVIKQHADDFFEEME